MKEKIRGITLVSLVVTIIVLIILAGVSINLTLGENGIITMAKRARENMELAQIDEERQLNQLYEQIVTEGGSSGNASDDEMIRLAEFKREIASAITDMGIETAENADASTMVNNIKNIINNADATKIKYDNTISGVSADNVQDAIDNFSRTIDISDKIVVNKGTLVYKMATYQNGYVDFTIRVNGVDITGNNITTIATISEYLPEVVTGCNGWYSNVIWGQHLINTQGEILSNPSSTIVNNVVTITGRYKVAD